MRTKTGITKAVWRPADSQDVIWNNNAGQTKHAVEHQNSHGAPHCPAALRGKTLMEPAHRGWHTICVPFFVKPPCVDVADRILLVYARNRRLNGAETRLIWARAHTHIQTYALTNTAAASSQIQACGGITHLHYHIANSAHSKDMSYQITVGHIRGEKAGKHTHNASKCVSEKSQKTYCFCWFFFFFSLKL